MSKINDILNKIQSINEAKWSFYNDVPKDIQNTVKKLEHSITGQVDYEDAKDNQEGKNNEGLSLWGIYLDVSDSFLEPGELETLLSNKKFRGLFPYSDQEVYLSFIA